MDRFKIIEKSKLEKLPKTTGVYLFRAEKDTIYIGKAINIQSRVKNHFQPAYAKASAGKATFKDNILSKKTTHVGFFETNNSEIEALILEANLIKKHQPKYNVIWKDDKNYFYVAIANSPASGDEKIPHVYITHQPNSSSLRGRSEATDEAIWSFRLPRRLRAPRNDGTQYIGPFVEGTTLKKTLRFLRRVFPYYTSARHPKNKCTYCHLDLCPGPRLFEAPASPCERGERLASPFGEATNLIAEYKKNIKKLILILKGKKNSVLNSLKQEMKQFSKENKFEKAGKTRDKIYNLQQVMSHAHVISAGDINENQIRHSSATAELRRRLKELLGFKKNSRIECYDVSNIQGKHATGSMVVFTNGKPRKNEYRKFKIRIENTPNDIAMLKEILQRRFAHPEWKYPEVILIDGGKAQLNVAIKTKNEAVVLYKRSSIQSVRVISIAKGKQDPLRPRSEARLFIENKKEPIPLKQLPQEIYNLIKQLDDEAHRFAIAYHKNLRKKNLLQ